MLCSLWWGLPELIQAFEKCSGWKGGPIGSKVTRGENPPKRKSPSAACRKTCGCIFRGQVCQSQIKHWDGKSGFGGKNLAVGSPGQPGISMPARPLIRWKGSLGAQVQRHSCWTPGIAPAWKPLGSLTRRHLHARLAGKSL